VISLDFASLVGRRILTVSNPELKAPRFQVRN
jgi:hypothetical protein